MMRSRTIRRALISAIALATVGSLRAADTPSKTRAHVEMLASSRLEGRLAGTRGEELAADYLVAQLQKIGAKPLPGQRDFRLPFEFTAGTKDGGSRLTIGATRFNTQTDVRALSFSDNAEVTGQVVFAGYGIVVPESQGFGYDSYATLDVKDKIVLVLRYFPEDADQKTRGILSRYADLRYKAMAARQRGATAMLVVTGPRSPNAGETVPLTFDTALAGSGIVAASISANAAKTIFAGVPGTTLDSTQQSFDSGNPHVAGFAIPNVSVTVRAAIRREKRKAHNVVGYLPATAGRGTQSKPWVAIGAHFDHLGHGEAGNTLASKDEVHKIHFGADDNASGSAAVLAIAATLATQPRARNVLVGFWSGEELGLIGSNAFATAPPLPLDSLAAYLNFDMVGRMQDNTLTVQAAGTSPMWSKLLEQAKSITEILQMNDRLDNVRLQIEQIQGRLKVLDQLSEMTTIDLTLSPFPVLAKVDDGKRSLSEAFADAWEASLDAVEEVAAAGIYAAVAALWLAIPVGLVFFAGRRMFRRDHGTTPAA